MEYTLYKNQEHGRIYLNPPSLAVVLAVAVAVALAVLVVAAVHTSLSLSKRHRRCLHVTVFKLEPMVFSHLSRCFRAILNRISGEL